MKKVDFERYKEVVQHLKKDLEISTILDMYQIEYRDTGNDLNIHCRNHLDEQPSFNIDKYKKVYHCFSCGVSGDLVNLIIYLEWKIKGNKSSPSKTIDRLLHNDGNLCRKLGYDTIFINQKDYHLYVKQRSSIDLTEVDRKIMKMPLVERTYDDWYKIIKMSNGQLTGEDIQYLVKQSKQEQETILGICEILRAGGK